MKPLRWIVRVVRTAFTEVVLALGPGVLYLLRLMNVFFWLGSLIPLAFIVGMVIEPGAHYYRDSLFLITLPLLAIAVCTTILQVWLRRFIERHLPPDTIVLF